MKTYTKKGCPYENCGQKGFKYLGTTGDGEGRDLKWYNCTKCHTTVLEGSLIRRDNGNTAKVETLEGKIQS